ncbi:50S ribosomal protein L10 [Pajaroellobacter abortibovis]|uniref:Large ribosomal subunit protein uL10 n=1 Tax=Pajaroellobacter abortibovis TaxID=1882918 RepID=A0A1L6MYF5_9BACT|nr:50S ribosomal protein L10 [Pajaroellobacter abortibovis]APS00438.1 50S ribosomal protein L10 [Pajaroellobacter abortibovis]
MKRTQKDEEIKVLKSCFDKMVAAVFVDYKGLTVAHATKLRQEFRKAGVEYKVVKNTLIKKALQDEPYGQELNDTLMGMTGVAWTYQDPSASAKVIKAFKKEFGVEQLRIKAGVVEKATLDAKAVEEQLATMPGKDELRALLLATLQASLRQFVVLLQAPSQNFVYLLSAKEKEGQN